MRRSPRPWRPIWSYRRAWFRDLIGPLVVSDQRLAEVGRALRQAQGTDGLAQGTLSVSVVNTGGAGGLLSLARREIPGVEVVAVESALRDLDDLAGNAARVASAAGELDEAVRVFVEIPYAAGLGAGRGRGRGGRPAGQDPHRQPGQLRDSDVRAAGPPAQRAGRGRPAVQGDGRPAPRLAGTDGPDPDRPRQHGFLNLLAAIDALVEGASESEAVDLLARVPQDEVLPASPAGTTTPPPRSAAGWSASAAAAYWTQSTTWSRSGLVEGAT